jgi:hypothetical protein
MKKLAVFMVAAMCSCSAFAVNGPYVGVGLGYSNTIFSLDQYATATIGSITGHSWRSYHGIAGGA